MLASGAAVFLWHKLGKHRSCKQCLYRPKPCQVLRCLGQACAPSSCEMPRQYGKPRLTGAHLPLL